MKTETAVVVGVAIVGAIVVYYIWQKNSTALTIGRNGITGQINVGQTISALGGLASSIANAFNGGHASSGGGYGDAQTTYMDSSGGYYDSTDGSTTDNSNLA